MSSVLKGVEGAMRGYRPQVDWGGEEGPATIKVGGHNVQVGTAGWRRRCLFVLLFALLLLSLINSIITIWVLREIGFNSEGAGSLRVVGGGVQLDGTFGLDHDLVVSRIRGQPSRDLRVSGYHNISLALVKEKKEKKKEKEIEKKEEEKKEDGEEKGEEEEVEVKEEEEEDEEEGRLRYTSGVVLDSSGIHAATREFLIRDSRGHLLFQSRVGNTTTGANFFTVSGQEGAAVFQGSLIAPRIQADEVHEFRLESRTRSVEGSAGNLLRIEARDGDVTVTSLYDVTMTSSKGKFRFESPNVIFPTLSEVGIRGDAADEPSQGQPSPPTSPPAILDYTSTTPATETQVHAPDLEMPQGDDPLLQEDQASSDDQTQSSEYIQVFQVCVCPSGKLFLAAADCMCIPDDVICR